MNLTSDQIKAHRKRYNLTQEQLADLAGVSSQKVRLAWEQKGITANQIKEAFVIVGMVGGV